MAIVDAVLVSYNSRAHLRAAVEPLAAADWVRVVVVDNASADGSLETLAGLPATFLPQAENGGFARGCNLGWRTGSAPYALLLNPDARIDAASLQRLVRVLDADPAVGAVAPRIVDPQGRLHFSQRRFPSLRSLYAQAFFLHRLLPDAAWTDELVREPTAYERPGSPEWVSGACLLVRRSALTQLGGLDEGFFLYWEDTDLCRRLRELGLDVRYEPGAVAVHLGGASAPRAALLPVLAASRLRYARKHGGRARAALERLGIALGALTHLVVARGGLPARAGHARSLLVAGSSGRVRHA